MCDWSWHAISFLHRKAARESLVEKPVLSHGELQGQRVLERSSCAHRCAPGLCLECQVCECSLTANGFPHTDVCSSSRGTFCQHSGCSHPSALLMKARLLEVWLAQYWIFKSFWRNKVRTAASHPVHLTLAYTAFLLFPVCTSASLARFGSLYLICICSQRKLVWLWFFQLKVQNFVSSLELWSFLAAAERPRARVPSQPCDRMGLSVVLCSAPLLYFQFTMA